MPKLQIRHNCGHRIRHNITGAEPKRASRQAWLKNQPCADCRRATEFGQARSFEQAEGLPPIMGFDKESQWAAAIRMRQAAPLLAAFAHQRDQVFMVIRRERSATFWIANRTAGPLELLRRLGRFK